MTYMGLARVPQPVPNGLMRAPVMSKVSGVAPERMMPSRPKAT